MIKRRPAVIVRCKGPDDVAEGLTLAAHGFALPAGINSTTGVAGLTLGGGYGWLPRRFGLTIDSMVGADVITPSGERLWASADQNQDLFWVLRGGSGNFGVVTSLVFEVHPLPHDVTAGLIIILLSKPMTSCKGFAIWPQQCPMN